MDGLLFFGWGKVYCACIAKKVENHRVYAIDCKNLILRRLYAIVFL